MTDQPEALLRAKEIEEWVKGLTFGVEEVRAATLLREQHAEIERLRAAVLAEREACAKVCEEDGLLWGQRYAAAIRARGSK